MDLVLLICFCHPSSVVRHLFSVLHSSLRYEWQAVFLSSVLRLPSSVFLFYYTQYAIHPSQPLRGVERIRCPRNEAILYQKRLNFQVKFTP
jgi:hypothetical protein